MRQRSDEILNRCCFCSSVKILGTISTNIVTISKSLVKTCLTVSVSKFSSSVVNHSFGGLSDLINCHIFSTVSHVHEFSDIPLFVISFCPFLKLLCYSNIANFLNSNLKLSCGVILLPTILGFMSPVKEIEDFRIYLTVAL